MSSLNPIQPKDTNQPARTPSPSSPKKPVISSVEESLGQVGGTFAGTASNPDSLKNKKITPSPTQQTKKMEQAALSAGVKASSNIWDEPSFFGKMTSPEAENVLNDQKVGSWLIRESTRGLCVSIKSEPNNIVHVILDKANPNEALKGALEKYISKRYIDPKPIELSTVLKKNISGHPAYFGKMERGEAENILKRVTKEQWLIREGSQGLCISLKKGDNDYDHILIKEVNIENILSKNVIDKSKRLDAAHLDNTIFQLVKQMDINRLISQVNKHLSPSSGSPTEKFGKNIDEVSIKHDNNRYTLTFKAKQENHHEPHEFRFVVSLGGLAKLLWD